MNIDEMKTWGLTQAITQIIEQGFACDEETGEVYFTSDDLEALNEALDKKINSIAGYIKYCDAKAKSFKERKAEIDNLMKSYEKKSEKLNNFLKEYMISNGKENGIETDDYKLSFRKSTASTITDEVLLKTWINASDERKDAYLKYKEPEIAKDALKKYLLAEDGIKIPGFELIENKNLQIK